MFVQRLVRADGTEKFRGYGWELGGRRVWTPVVDDPTKAHVDAVRLRVRLRGAPKHVVTLEQAFELVLLDVERKRTAGTHAWYANAFAQLRRHWPGDPQLHEIGLDAIERFVTLRLRKVSAATVNRDLRALNRVFTIALRRGLVPENPVPRVERPREEPRRPDAFSGDELAGILERMRAAGDLAAYDLVALMAHTGLRRAEVGRLRVGDLDGRRGALFVQGKRGGRTVPLAPQITPTVARLTEGRKGSEVLFRGGEDEVRRVFRRWVRKLEDPRFHPHALRHTFAILLVRAGERVDVVQHLMGHRTLQMTMRYYGSDGEEATRAVGRLRLVQAEEGEQVGAAGA